MKKIVILFILFLFSCSWEVEEETSFSWKIKNSWELDFISKSKENIKQICETAKIWERFFSLEEKFWDAVLLSKNEENWKSTTTYYYWKVWWEMCMIFVSEKGEIVVKNYIR